VRPAYLLLLLLSVAACSDDVATAPVPVEEPPPPPPPTCEEQGEIELPDGSCLRLGPGADDCVDGFVHDGEACVPVLPEQPCPIGQMAVPGEESCREVAPCGSGTWGDIPMETNTQYVDQSYTGGGSDGSTGKPWLTVEEGVAAAEPGAIVAIAEGTYPVVLVIDQPVRLWGRCPELVELVGQPGEFAAVPIFYSSADGSEIHDLAITGFTGGVLVDGPVDVLLDRLWIHAILHRGVGVETSLTPTSAVVSRSLIENVFDTGVVAFGSTVTVEASLVRNSRPLSGEFGRGISFQTMANGRRSVGTIRGSVIEDNYDIDVVVQGSDVTIDGSVMRNGKPSQQRAITVENDEINGERSSASIRGLMIEHVFGFGITALGSDVTVEQAVVRDVQPTEQGARGLGLAALFDPLANERSSMTVSTVLVSDVYEIGISALGSDFSIDNTIVRNVSLNADGDFGRGINAAPSDADTEQASLAISGSLVEQVHEVGISIDGAPTTIDSTVVRDVLLGGAGTFGRGISAQTAPASLTVTNSIVERVHEFGVLAAGIPLVVDGVISRDVAANAAGDFGDGFSVAWLFTDATAAVNGVLAENAARAALSNFGAHVELTNSTFRCSTLDLNGEVFNGVDFSFIDHGGNQCGCPEVADQCAVVSAGISGPTAP
jgi:hypothetical protein